MPSAVMPSPAWPSRRISTVSLILRNTRYCGTSGLAKLRHAGQRDFGHSPKGNAMQRDPNSIKGEFTRRAMVSAAAGLAAATSAPPAKARAEGCRIGPAPHPKGPLVFMDYDQIELDAAYDQSAYAPLAA